jgi:hypothetical protein
MTVIEFSRAQTSGRLSRDVATHPNLDDLIAAHKAARTIRLSMDAANVPDGPEYDAAQEAEDAAMSAIVKVPCTRDQLIEKLAYIFACDQHDAGEAPCQGDDYGPVAIAVQAFLEQRQA